MLTRVRPWVHRSGRLSIAAVAVVLVVAADPAGAYGTPLSADLEGTPITLRDVGRYHCHDLAYPRLHCFRTSERSEAAVRAIDERRTTRTRRRTSGSAATTAASYVRIFDGSGYAGSSAYLSQSYSTLGTIGWDNRVSSFKSLNLGYGAFYTGTSYGGTSRAFAGGDAVSSLGGLDNTFSSVQGTA
jgi:hypothetical protein